MIAARLLLAACAVAAAAFALFAGFQVYTETAEGPIAIAGAAVAAIAVEGLVLVGVLVAAGWFARGRIAPAVTVAVLFLVALPISLTTTAAWLASQDQASASRRVELARQHETAATALASAQAALVAYDARTAAAAAAYRAELVRTPAEAATARRRLVETIAGVERSADDRRVEYVQAVRDAETRLAASPPPSAIHSARGEVLAGVFGSPERAEAAAHWAIAIMLELVKAFGLFAAFPPRRRATIADTAPQRAPAPVADETTPAEPVASGDPLPERQVERAPRRRAAAPATLPIDLEQARARARALSEGRA